MSTSRLLDHDPLTGITRTFEYDHATEQFTVGTFQDIEPIVEHNKRMVIEADHRKQMKNDWIKYASIPVVLIERWKTQHGVDFFDPNDWKAVMGLINSPDYSAAVKTSDIYHDR